MIEEYDLHIDNKVLETLKMKAYENKCMHLYFKIFEYMDKCKDAIKRIENGNKEE